jgi:hypothetical protein
MSRRRNTEPDPEPAPLTSSEAGAFTGWYAGMEDHLETEEPELEDAEPKSALDQLAEELFREYHSQLPGDSSQ